MVSHRVDIQLRWPIGTRRSGPNKSISHHFQSPQPSRIKLKKAQTAVSPIDLHPLNPQTNPAIPFLHEHPNIFLPHIFIIYIKRGNTSQQIQQFFVHRTNMHIQITYSLFRDQQLSLFGDQDDHYQNQVDLLMDKQRITMCSRIQNSIYEMEEILNHFTYDSPLLGEKVATGSNSTLQAENRQGEKKTEEENSRKKSKKIKKASNSPFHNYQKHLNNALKKLIIVPEFEANDGEYKSAAIDIWNAYLKSQIKTKRILHFVFNERNQHAINDPQLKNYGLWNVYQSYTEDTISHAKTYLSKLAIDQLDDQNIEGYLKTRKLKSKLGFKEYIVSFKSELEGGYLKRRINIDKALN